MRPSTSAAPAAFQRAQLPFDWRVVRTSGVFLAGMALGRLFSLQAPPAWAPCVVRPAEFRVEMDPLVVRVLPP